MIQYSAPYTGKTIPGSGGTPVTISSLLSLTAAQKGAVRGVEIRGHDAAFDYSRASDHASNVETQAAYDPYYRKCMNDHLDDTYLRADGVSAITGVVVEVEFAPH